MQKRIAVAGYTLVGLGLVAGCDPIDRLVEPPLSAEEAARSIASSRFGDWSAPVNLGPTVNSPFTEFGPALWRDGQSLYFTSDRPGGLGGLDLWVARRGSEQEPWGTPVNLGAPVNSPSNEVAPNFSRDGHLLLFTSSRPGGSGGNDLWVSRRADVNDDFAWADPENLGAPINAPGFDAGPNLQLPELYLASDRVSGNLDIFVARLGPGGDFGPPALLPELSSPFDDARPSPTFDGLEIFFHSARPGGLGGVQDIWMSTRASKAARWEDPVNLGPGINSAFLEVQPFISTDGLTLLFSSTRPGGSGFLDLYMATRSIGGR